MKDLAEILRNTDSSEVEFGLQTCWPDSAMSEQEKFEVILSGIRSSPKETWTHNQRPAPETPRPDAWVYVPGQMLLVFEWKNDDHPLDATQISAYAHSLKLFKEEDGVPRAASGMNLASIEEATHVQNACSDLVLDVSWDAVADALEKGQEDQDDLGRWLCNKAAEYVRWHIRPRYSGIQTILEWLNGPDTTDRRSHLRTLVRRMGDGLEKSGHGTPSAITFAKDKKGNWDLRPGSGSAVYVFLKRTGEERREWLGRKIDAVLYFQFAEHGDQLIDLEYYMQAGGSHSSGRGDQVAAWNKASKNYSACAERFEQTLAEWIQQASPTGSMIVSRVRFNGKKQNWQGGGVDDKDFKKTPQIKPQKALEYLRQHCDELWIFPRVEKAFDNEEAALSNIAEAALEVRKPALSLKIPLDVEKLISWHEDGLAQYLESVLNVIV